MTRKMRPSAPGVGDAVLQVRGNLDERARLDVPGLLADLHAAGPALEVERVVLGVAVRWRSAAGPNLVS
jgi:hypothetical protein